MRTLGIEKNAAFYKAVFALALPLALQSTLMFSVTTLDSIMLGSLGEIPMSASAIANQPFQVSSGIYRGLTMGGCMMVSQYWGKGDMGAIKRLIGICMRWSFLIAVVTAVATFAFPQQIMGIFTTDAAVIEAGVSYLRIMSFTYGMYAISNVYMLALRSTEDARTPFFTNLVSYGLNIFFNYAFIFGKFGFPQMGITGVAIGTLITRGVELAICLTHMLFVNKHYKVRWRHIVCKDKVLSRDFFRFGVPAMLSELVYTLGMAAYSVVFGRLGTVTMAANTISEVVQRILTLVTGGFSGASATLIGKTIGQGDIQRVRRQKNSFVLMVSVLALVMGIIGIFGKDFALSLYNVSDETKGLTRQMIIVIGIINIPRCLEALFDVGIFVGSGDTKHLFGYTTVIMWCITMPLAFLGAFVFGWSPIVIFCILKMDYVLKSIYSLIRTAGTKWIKIATKDLPPDDSENKEIASVH